MGLEVSGASELYHTHVVCECVGRCITRASQWNDSTVTTTSIKTTLTFTVKFALDADHRYALGKDLLLKLARGEEVKGID